jgi:hypothetical protein
MSPTVKLSVSLCVFHCAASAVIVQQQMERILVSFLALQAHFAREKVAFQHALQPGLSKGNDKDWRQDLVPLGGYADEFTH